MLASRAIAIDFMTGPIDFGSGGEIPAERTACHPLVLSLAPALDTAFGLEPAALFPEAIAALVAEIEAGPLGAATLPAHPLELA